jgi:hypothetical protein
MTTVELQQCTINAPLPFSVQTPNRLQKQSPMLSTTNKLFGHYQRSPTTSSSSVLSIVSTCSLADSDAEFIRIKSNNHVVVKHMPSSIHSTVDVRSKMSTHDVSSKKLPSTNKHRSIMSTMKQTSASNPTIPYRLTSLATSQQQQQQQQLVQGSKLPSIGNVLRPSHRTSSARTPSITHVSSSTLNQQTQLVSSSMLTRPHSQYSHFLAYLRRQSLARLRRRQEQDGCHTSPTECSVVSDTSKSTGQTSTTVSNVSHCKTSSDTTSTTRSTSPVKRSVRDSSTNRSLLRSSSSIMSNNYNWIGNSSVLSRQTRYQPGLATQPSRSQFTPLLPSSLSTTSTSSMVDDGIVSSLKKTPYALQLTGDMLNYYYVSDSGMKYQGQILSTVV